MQNKSKFTHAIIWSFIDGYPPKLISFDTYEHMSTSRLMMSIVSTNRVQCTIITSGLLNNTIHNNFTLLSDL